MATERQIDSNQRNARVSTGPTTPEGKAQSRANALKHGPTASTLVSDGVRADFTERKAEWDQHNQPLNPEGRFALEAVVASTIWIEECRRNINARHDLEIPRACLVCDLDREPMSPRSHPRLAKEPEAVPRQFKSSKHGVELILRTWGRVGESLDIKKGAWNDAELSTAFDLLGIPNHLRYGRALFDPRRESEDI